MATKQSGGAGEHDNSEKLAKIRDIHINYFDSALEWTSTVRQAMEELAARNHSSRMKAMKDISDNLKDNILDFNRKSDMLFLEIINGNIPPTLVGGDFAVKSDKLQSEFKALKVALEAGA